MARADSVGCSSSSQPARSVRICASSRAAPRADEHAERLVEELHALVGRGDRRERAQRVGDGVRRVQDPRLGELLLDQAGRGGDLAPRGEDPGQPAAPGQPGVVVRGGELLAGALEVGHRLVGLAPRRGELAETEAGAGGHGSADAHQRGQLAGERCGAAQVAAGQPRQQPGQGELDPGILGEVVVVARTVHQVQGVGDAALQQRVAGFDEYTGGNVRCRFE